MQDDNRRHTGPRLSRRAALQLGAGAGVAAVAAPYLSRFGSDAVDLSGAVPAFRAIPNWPVPPIITRAQWGANEALRHPGQTYNSVVQKIIVHHTGTPNDITNYAGLCRGIFQSEVANTQEGYIDIAYNWLIDPRGNIYEGRWAQNYQPGVPHTGELRGANVQGAHAIYHNIDTIGIALMGTYDAIGPSPAMINGLVTLLAWKCARWGIDPNGRGIYHASNGAFENLFNICGHRDTSATDCPGQRMEPLLPAVRAQTAARLGGGGYWIAADPGQVFSFGGVRPGGFTPYSSLFAGIAAPPSAAGYWGFSWGGEVHSFGLPFFGSMWGHRLNAPIVAMASTPNGGGYWLLGLDGGVFTFGNARFHGSTGGMRLNAPVLGIAPTPSGNGYWLVARDGGIFCFGDARFFGSTGNIRLREPVVGMAARPQGDGYWLVAADGGIFAFGRAPFRGSWANATTLPPVVGMLPTVTGNGYVMLRRDGSVGSFGDAPNLGSAAGIIPGPAVGIAGRIKAL